MTDSEPERRETPIWEMVPAWCPPSGSPLLGARDTEHAGVASNPGAKERRRFGFGAKKQTGDVIHREKDRE
jgi:hypothetical protein